MGEYGNELEAFPVHTLWGIGRPFARKCLLLAGAGGRLCNWSLGHNQFTPAEREGGIWGEQGSRPKNRTGGAPIVPQNDLRFRKEYENGQYETVFSHI